MEAQKSVSMLIRTDFVGGTYGNKKYLQARANLSVCSLSNTHRFQVWILQIQRTPKPGISKQQEAAIQKQWEDRLWKASQKTTQVIIL